MDQIPEPVREAVAVYLAKEHIPATSLKITPVGGGCINNACCINAGKDKFFLKWNEATDYPGMFEAEAKGLQLLRSSRAIPVPAVLEASVAGSKSYLLLEWVEAGKRKPGFWSDFGVNLAKLHRVEDAAFGLDHDNYIGSLKQRNRKHPDWWTFFSEERIGAQLRLASDAGKISAATRNNVLHFIGRSEEIFPEEPPSLLHGDLWSGNFMADSRGDACVIDPAVYYGFREVDLAMTILFGGFEKEFYRAYQEEYPLEDGFEERFQVLNLYPLLVHVNLFGGSYVEQVNRIVGRLH